MSTKLAGQQHKCLFCDYVSRSDHVRRHVQSVHPITTIPGEEIGSIKCFECKPGKYIGVCFQCFYTIKCDSDAPYNVKQCCKSHQCAPKKKRPDLAGPQKPRVIKEKVSVSESDGKIERELLKLYPTLLSAEAYPGYDSDESDNESTFLERLISVIERGKNAESKAIKLSIQLKQARDLLPTTDST
jgi:hypothetical protein